LDAQRHSGLISLRAFSQTNSGKTLIVTIENIEQGFPPPTIAGQAMKSQPTGVIASAMLLAFSMTSSSTLSETVTVTRDAAKTSQFALTTDQRAIIELITKGTEPGNVRYAPAPSESIGAEIMLPFREGKSIVLTRVSSMTRNDGSIWWHGKVKETGERAVLLLWGNALLTGYLAYDGTIYSVENLGGGIHSFAE
jgi:hypothetical protein